MNEDLVTLRDELKNYVTSSPDALLFIHAFVMLCDEVRTLEEKIVRVDEDYKHRPVS